MRVRAGKVSGLVVALLCWQIAMVYGSAELKRGRVKLPRRWVPHWVLEVVPLDDTVEIKALSKPLLQRLYLEEPIVIGNGERHGQLIDPQQFLNAHSRRRIEGAIAKHSMTSVLPVYLYVFGGHQYLSESVTPESIYQEKLLGDGAREPVRAVVVFYFMGEPQRARGYLHGGVDGEADVYAVKELLRKSARAAAQSDAEAAPSESEELQRFIGELSRRMFWVERELIKPQFSKEKPQQVAEKKPSRLDSLTQWFQKLRADDSLSPVWYSLLGLLLLGMVLVLRFIRIRTKKYHFPEPICSHRLGAENGAELSELISYKNPQLSLDQQRKKLKENF